jgi:hypothetical protein
MQSDDSPAPETGVLDHGPGEEEREWLDEPSELPPRPRRRLLAPIPLALCGVLLIACGFIAGVQVQKGQGSPAASATAGLASRFAALGARGAGAGAAGGRSAAAGFPAGAGAGGFGAGASGAGSLTTGEVSYVRGNTIYVADSQGNTVKVSAAAASKVTKTVSTKASAIHPGETVVVIGTQAKNGSISARSISVSSGGSSSGATSSTSSSSSTSESGTPALFGPG